MASVSSSVAPRELVLGRVRKGGAVFFKASTGSQNRDLYLAIALAGHEIDAVEGIYLNDQLVALDANGFVSEGAGENLFLVRDGVIHTPAVANSILQGITRDTVMTLAREHGFDDLGITGIDLAEDEAHLLRSQIDNTARLEHPDLPHLSFERTKEWALARLRSLDDKQATLALEREKGVLSKLSTMSGESSTALTVSIAAILSACFGNMPASTSGAKCLMRIMVCGQPVYASATSTSSSPARPTTSSSTHMM